jgi:superfamily I DNA/RNA helicase
MGYYYALSGKPPVTPEKIRALSTWRTLAAGGEVFLPQIKDLYQNVPKQGPRAVLKRGASSLLDAAAADERFTMDSLVRNYGMREDAVDRAAFDVLALGDHLSQYLRRIELMGEDITKEPRIKIGTIHSMKGGEDDICVLFTGTNRFIEETASLEGEHRVFYVGVTRAKRVLHIVQPPLYDRNHRNYRYEI